MTEDNGTPTSPASEGTPTPAEPAPAADAAGSSPPPASNGEPEAGASASGPPPAAAEPASGAADGVTWQERRMQQLEAENAALRAGKAPPAEPEPAAGASTTGTGAPAPKPIRRFTEAEVQARATLIAQQQLQQEAFDEACNDVASEGGKVFKDFNTKIADFQKFGGVSPAFLEAAVESGAGHLVLYSLAGNLDEAARINSLPPVKMVAEITRLAGKLTAPKPVTGAPAPIEPIEPGAGGMPPTGLTDRLSTDEWMKRRNAEIEKRDRTMH